MASPALGSVPCAPLAGSCGEGCRCLELGAEILSSVQRNTVLVLLLPVYWAREVLGEWGSDQEASGWSWALPAWAPTLGEGIGLAGLGFHADLASVSCPAPCNLPALNPLPRQNCLNQFVWFREAKDSSILGSTSDPPHPVPLPCGLGHRQALGASHFAPPALPHTGGSCQE